MEKEESSDDVCFLCDQKLNEKYSVVKEKAIKSFIIASIKRGDQKYIVLKTKDSLKIHSSCHVKYVRDSSIKSAVKNKSAKRRKVKLSANVAMHFDYENCCLFCGDDASPSYLEKVKKNPSRYSTVSEVKNNDSIATVIDIIKQRAEKDEIYKNIYLRIKDKDLCAEKARYHRLCLRHVYNERLTNIRGRPLEDSIANVLQFVLNYIFEHDDECQFSLRNIVEQYEGQEKINIRYVKEKLQEILRNDIVIHTLKNDYILSFIDCADKISINNWSSESISVEDREKKILESAANIILRDIRKQYHDMSNYPDPNNFLHDAQTMIPESLSLLLSILIKTNKKSKTDDLSKWDKRVTTLCHCIMSSVRPNSFLSPILLGLSSYMHTKHASKNLIEALSHLGLCAPHSLQCTSFCSDNQLQDFFKIDTIEPHELHTNSTNTEETVAEKNKSSDDSSSENKISDSPARKRSKKN